MKISELFTEFGSDKATEHSYGDFYDNLVESKSISSILEVGVEAGYSMSAWKKLLPEALVIGIDRDVTPEDSLNRISLPQRRRILRDKSRAQMLRHDHVHPAYRRLPGLEVIQCVAPDFFRAIDLFRSRSIKFDLIIDDASHTESDQVLTHHYLQEFLGDDGVYVIEDVQNEEAISRLKVSGWEILDLRDKQGRWDDVIAFRKKGG